MKKNGFTINETLLAIGIFIFFITSVLGASMLVNNICNSSILAHGLQRDAALIIRQIAARDTGEIDFVGLRSATALVVDIAHPTDLVFNGNERRYRATVASIIYFSPTIPGGSKVIYAAPNGVTIRFGYQVINAERVRLNLILSQPFSGRTISGSARLVVPLKNVI
jgi:hypothetical protein